MMSTDELFQAFANHYGHKAEFLFFAPGRVNLIGEHTDYNGGPVFPCALSFGTYMLIAANSDNVLRFRSLNQSITAEIGIRSDFSPLPDRSWINYPLGTVAQLRDAGMRLDSGFDILFYGDVPQGAGLSSSASIEVVTAFAFNHIYNLSFNLTELARMAQEAEHRYAGVNCGIMDQFASAHGKKDCAIYLNCSSLDFKHVPLKLEGVKIVLSNTCSPHKLESSMYNKRVEECNEALNCIRRETEIGSLAELTPDTLNAFASAIGDKRIFSRALHVVSEVARTKRAVEALHNKDLALFGQLMNESHISLRDNYEVTGFELDTMAEIAWNTEGVIGSRMTGGGFGGCTVSLVREEAVDEYVKRASREYKTKTGLQPAFYIADVGDGARRLI